MDNDRSELRWGVEQRLEFIEFRLFWEGHVNRRDLMDQFGVSVNQASTDLRSGSVDLNKFRAFSKWISAFVMPLPHRASAG
jgi:hypothetical protein